MDIAYSCGASTVGVGRISRMDSPRTYSVVSGKPLLVMPQVHNTVADIWPCLEGRMVQASTLPHFSRTSEPCVPSERAKSPFVQSSNQSKRLSGFEHETEPRQRSQR